MADQVCKKRKLTRARVQRFRDVRRQIASEFVSPISINNSEAEFILQSGDQKYSGEHPRGGSKEMEVINDEEFYKLLADEEIDDNETLEIYYDAIGCNDELVDEDCETKDRLDNNDTEVFRETEVQINDVEFQQLVPGELMDNNEASIEGFDDVINSYDGLDGEASEAEEELDANDAEEEEWDDITQLRNWALESNIPQTQLDKLLCILRQRLLPQLPACSKTFLKTAKAEYRFKEFKDPTGSSVGEFVYFGIAKNLQNTINTAIHEGNVLHLQINIDGLPLYKSSTRQFWPILCKVQFQPDVYDPFPIAIYSGTQKPTDLHDYLADFIEEINEIMESGILIDGKKFEVRIASFICDRPARSFVKCIKGHGGYYACERCTVEGERYENRTIYSSIDSVTRSDESFRKMDDPHHHTGFSPLALIRPGIDMILRFVLDFMHLCCLGVMKKLLTDCWLQGSLTTRLNNGSKLLLSQRLINLQSQIPIEFQRTTRSLFDVARWKATEFRFFLLYGGPVVLKKVLSAKLYKHFLLFSVACRILCSKNLAVKYHGHAKLYLRSFVRTAKYLYGKNSQVMNMHSLIHLADDVKNMGCPLSEFTAFPFENSLGKMKKMLRSGRRPLAQLCRRIHESFFASKKKATLPSPVTIIRKLRQTPTGNVPIKKLRYKEATLSNKSPNNTVQLHDGRFLAINDMNIPPKGNIDNIQVSGSLLKKKKSIFTYPCDSKDLNMWEVEVEEKASLITCPLRDISLKMVLLKVSDELERDTMYVMPLLHS